jgi:hypothetical protein
MQAINFLIMSVSGNEKKVLRKISEIKKFYCDFEINICVAFNGKFEINEESLDIKFIEFEDASFYQKPFLSQKLLIEEAPVIFIPDDDGFFYLKNDIKNFIEFKSDYAALNYCMINRLKNEGGQTIFHIFNGWIHHKYASKVENPHQRVADFVDQGVATVWGLYSFSHFSKVTKFWFDAANYLSNKNINLEQILEDCGNIINLYSKFTYCPDSWCVRMLDRKSTNKATWVSGAKCFNYLFEKDKNRLTKLINNLANISEVLTSKKETAQSTLETLKRHVQGYISANSRIWRNNFEIYFIPYSNIDSAKNYTKSGIVFTSNTSKDECKILIEGNILGAKSIPLDHSWFSSESLQNALKLYGEDQIFKHEWE